MKNEAYFIHPVLEYFEKTNLHLTLSVTALTRENRGVRWLQIGSDWPQKEEKNLRLFEPKCT